MTVALVELRSVTKRFGDFVAVDGVSLAIAPGEFLTLLGASGSGKTTTLRMIAGFDQPTAGEIWMEGQSIHLLPPNKRHVNTVFQNYALFPHMSVWDNVAYGLKMRRVAKAEIPSGSDRCSRWCTSSSSPAACRASCREGSSSVWPWPARW